MTRSFLPGLELAELFHAEVVAPILEKALAGVPYSAALIGWGSEVQGFDTPRSTDHAWGPRMQLFLDHNDFQARANDLDTVLDHALPAEFRGHPVRFAVPSGAPARHWVQVTDLLDFFVEHLAADPGSGLTTSAWLTVPTQVLRELTGGAVFHDGLGLLEPYRQQLTWFPDDVWRYVLACQWMRLSQEEPFVGRCGEVGDDLGSAVVAARQVRDLMRLCLLMNRIYPPYSKWLGTAFAALPCATKLTPHLSAALSARNWQQREQHLPPPTRPWLGCTTNSASPNRWTSRSATSTTDRSESWTPTGSPTPSSRRSATPLSEPCPRSARSTSTSTTPTSPTGPTPHCAAATSQVPDSSSGWAAYTTFNGQVELTRPRSSVLAWRAGTSETGRVTGFVVLTVGVVCVLVGGIWTLQGLGVIGGSFMTNSPTWLVIGLVVTVTGLAMIILGTRGRRKKV